MWITWEALTVLLAAVGIVFTIATYLGTRLREHKKAAKLEGAESEMLKNVIADVEQIKREELPILRQVQIQQRENAIHIGTLVETVKEIAELHRERNRLTDELVRRFLAEDK